MFAPTDGAAPEYFECPGCAFLSGDPAFMSPQAPCPMCGSAGAERRTWPAERIRRLDARIRRYQADGESEVVVILAMTLLETILEDLLDRMLTAHGADLKVRRMVMDTQRAIGLRLGKLFPALAGEDFEEAASELGHADFPKRWRRLREARNAFIHDSPFTGPQEHLDQHAADEAMVLLDQAYRLFVLMNNRFVADGLHSE